jgi:hypothetical protein
VPVVRLDDLDVVPGGERPRRHVQQSQHHVDAHAHVRCHHDRQVLRMCRDLGLLRVAEARGADHRLDAVPSARREVRQRAFGPREVDQHLRVAQPCVQVGRDAHAAVATQEGRRVAADGRAAGHVQCTRQLQVGRRHDGLDQHPSHAARRTRDGHAQRGHWNTLRAIALRDERFGAAGRAHCGSSGG